MRSAASYQPPGSRIIGIGFVVALHVALIYALVTALAHRSTDVIHAPIETKIIDQAPQEKAEPPPPQPKFAPPPPPFIPPPEINIRTPPPPAQSTAPTVITTVKPAVIVPTRIEPRIDAQHSQEPEYPPQSRRLGEQGSVVLDVLVDGNGRVTQTKLVQSCGFPRLDQAALDGVKSSYRFFPGTIDGKPQPMWHRITVNWRLR